MPLINADPQTFINYYPLVEKRHENTPRPRWVVKLRDPGRSLLGELDDWVTTLKNQNPNYTTCCIQMSHAIDRTFYPRHPEKMIGGFSTRRPPRRTRSFRIASAGNTEFHYLAAVDEMKGFLNATFGEGEEISHLPNGRSASKDEVKEQIHNRPGIVVFMNNHFAGEHTEIWDGTNFHQGWMQGKWEHFVDWAPVWFWEMGLTPTLSGPASNPSSPAQH